MLTNPFNKLGGKLMKKITLISILILIFPISLISCSNKEQDSYSYIEIVEKSKDSKLQNIDGIEDILINGETIVGIENAQTKYPNYKIIETPTIFIFRDNGGDLKKLVLKTNNVKEATDFLEKRLRDN
jgi:hypothetical protein